MERIIITLDGWSSCGKSTLARQLAKDLGYIFIDSGAMYRAIALFFIDNHIDLNDIQHVQNALKKINLHFEHDSLNGKSFMFLNGQNVETEIRKMEVAQLVSEVAAIPEVREFAVNQQRKIGEKKGIVMDGRDIGTTVFPEAELKIFMTAENEIRVSRRYNELKANNPTISMDEVRENLLHRDYIDSHREVSPLRKADDALVLDNSNLTPHEQLEIALNWARNKINA